MEECDRCAAMKIRLADMRECKASHQQAAGRLARRNSDLKDEIKYLQQRILELSGHPTISV